MSVSWLSMEDLGALERRHLTDDSVNKAIAWATSVDFICVDGNGLLPISAGSAEGFYRIIEVPHVKRPLTISSTTPQVR